MATLKDITTRLHQSYKAEKDAKKDLDAVKGEFYLAATNTITSTTTLARQTVEVPYDVDPEEHIGRFHPGWRIHSLLPNTDKVIIEEDPSLLKFVWMDPETEMVFQRIIKTGSPTLDDERMREEDPALWCRITDCPEELVLYQLATEAGGDLIPRVVDNFVEKHQERFHRVLKPLETLPAQDLALLQKYLIPGSLSLSLGPPRKAKPDEL